MIEPHPPEPGLYWAMDASGHWIPCFVDGNDYYALVRWPGSIRPVPTVLLGPLKAPAGSSGGRWLST